MKINFFKRKKKKKLSSILYHPRMIALIGFIIISVISVPLWEKISERQRLNAEINNLKKEIDQLNVNNNNLSQLIDYLKSDYFTEEQARLDLGLKKEGEKVFVVKNNNQKNINKPTNLNNNSVSNQRNEMNTDRWFNYFFGK